MGNYVKALVVALAVMLTGCARDSIMLNDRTDPKVDSLVFGYIDMTEAPVSMNKLTLEQLSPKPEKPYYWYAEADGMLFVHSWMKPGIYQVEAFEGERFNGYSVNRFVYVMPHPNNTLDQLKIDKVGLYYMGSYKFRALEKNIWGSVKKFDLVRINKPTERELLERMLPYAKSPDWQARIKKRIHELGGK